MDSLNVLSCGSDVSWWVSFMVSFFSVCVHACNIICTRHTFTSHPTKKKGKIKSKTSCHLRQALAHQRCSFTLPFHTRSDPATLRSMLRRCIRVHSRPHRSCLHSRSRASTTHSLQDASALLLTRRIPLMTKARVLPEYSQNSDLLNLLCKATTRTTNKKLILKQNLQMQCPDTFATQRHY